MRRLALFTALPANLASILCWSTAGTATPRTFSKRSFHPSPERVESALPSMRRSRKYASYFPRLSSRRAIATSCVEYICKGLRLRRSASSAPSESRRSFADPAPDWALAVLDIVLDVFAEPDPVYTDSPSAPERYSSSEKSPIFPTSLTPLDSEAKEDMFDTSLSPSLTSSIADPGAIHVATMLATMFKCFSLVLQCIILRSLVGKTGATGSAITAMSARFSVALPTFLFFFPPLPVIVHTSILTDLLRYPSSGRPFLL